MIHRYYVLKGLDCLKDGGIEAYIITSNYLNNDTLLDAQKTPDSYRDLVVRVAGYSAFFVELCKDVQDEIISRTVLHSVG